MMWPGRMGAVLMVGSLVTACGLPPAQIALSLGSAALSRVPLEDFVPSLGQSEGQDGPETMTQRPTSVTSPDFAFCQDRIASARSVADRRYWLDWCLDGNLAPDARQLIVAARAADALDPPAPLRFRESVQLLHPGKILVGTGSSTTDIAARLKNLASERSIFGKSDERGQFLSRL